MNLRYLLIGLLASVVLFSCGGNKSSKEASDEKSTSLSEAVSGLKALDKLADSAEDVEKIQKELEAKTPLSNDEMKTLVPEELDGMKRRSFTVGSPLAVGMNMAEATYAKEEQEAVSLSILDGAGETGAGIVSLALMSLSMDREEQTESGFSKTTKIGGNRATVKENKGEGWVESELTTVISNRYIITLSSRTLELKDLEKAFQTLDLSKMK